MIKQTVSYGVWTLNRHDDNKIEVLKNGQVCEKASPAYREIAAEIGFEIDPEWRTSQLGRNVFKAVENAANSSCSSTTASTPVEEKKTSATEQEPAPKKTISEDKNTQPIQEVSQNETISVFDVILQSEGENKLQVVKAVKEQLGIGLGEAKELVDAAPSTIAKGVDRSTAEKLKLELESVGAEVKINFVKSINVEDTEEIYSLCINNHIEALEWLCTKCCKSRVYGGKFIKLIEYNNVDKFIKNLEKLGWSDAGFVKNHNALQVLASTIYTTTTDKISAFKILIEKKLLPYLIYNIDLDDMYETFRRCSKDYTSKSEDYGKVLYHLCWNEIYKNNNPKAAYILYGLYATSLYDLHIRHAYHPLLFNGMTRSSENEVYNAIRTFLADCMMRFAPKDSEIYLFGEKHLKYKDQEFNEHWGKYGQNEDQKKELEKSYKELEKRYKELEDKCQVFKDHYTEQYLKNNKNVREYNELVDKYNELVRTIKEERSDYNKLVDRFQSTLESASSSSSSSSSSSDDDTVRVRVNFTTDNKWWNAIRGGAQTISMPESEYKALLKGSMKARIAFVHDKFNVPSSYKVSDVSISLA